MGRFTHRFSGCVLGLGLFLAGTGVAVADIVVRFSGTQGIPFTAQWEWTGPGQEHRSGTWAGRAPRVERLPDGRSSMTVIQQASGGRLEVLVTGRGNRSSSSSSGAGATMLFSLQ